MKKGVDRRAIHPQPELQLAAEPAAHYREKR